MISEFLNDMTKIEDLEAIALYRSDNALIDTWFMPNFDQNIFDLLSIHYFQIFSILSDGFRDFQEVVLSHSQGKIYVRAIPDLLLIVIGKSSVDISLVRLIINVKIADFLKSRKLQKFLKKASKKSINFLQKKYLDDREIYLLNNIKSK